MRLCTILSGGKAAVGVKNDDGKIIDLSKQMPRGPKSVVEILAGGKKLQAAVPKEKPLGAIAGYACFNDGSVRDWQRKSGGQFTLGKNFDGTGGFGPDIVTSDELPPGAAPLRIMTRVNGEVMQDSNTDDLIFDVPTLVHELSKVLTLDPGVIIITGTPSSVPVARKPQPWLKPGDVCEVEIEKIGVLRNPIVQGAYVLS